MRGSSGFKPLSLVGVRWIVLRAGRIPFRGAYDSMPFEGSLVEQKEQTQPTPLLDYVSRTELETRWVRVRREMDCDALIVVQNVDLYYLAGTTQNGVLWFPA